MEVAEVQCTEDTSVVSVKDENESLDFHLVTGERSIRVSYSDLPLISLDSTEMNDDEEVKDYWYMREPFSCFSPKVENDKTTIVNNDEKEEIAEDVKELQSNRAKPVFIRFVYILKV